MATFNKIAGTIADAESVARRLNALEIYPIQDPANVAITGGTINGIPTASLGIGSYNPANVAITGGTISGVSSVAVAGALSSTGIISQTGPNPVISQFNAGNEVRLGMASGGGAYSPQALTGDAILAALNGRVVIAPGASSTAAGIFSTTGLAIAGALSATGTVNFGSGAQTMTLDASGYLLVGTANNPAGAQMMLTKAGGAQGFEFLPGVSASRNTVLNYNRITNAYLTSGINALDHTWELSGTRAMTLNGSGRLLLNTATDDGFNQLQVNGPAKISGALSSTGTISPQQAAAAPAYVKGAMYFDTTLNKLRIGGVTAWETVTSA